jgi:xanthosine utilization system XapX-like protein
VDQTDDRLVSRVAELLLGLVFHFMTVRVEKPVVVCVLVVVASDLLLSRTIRVGLNVGMKQTSTVAHILQSSARAICHLQRTIFANLGSAQVGLEEGAHLGVSWATVFEDEEVQIERKEVDRERNQNQAKHAESYVCDKLDFRHLEVSKFVPEIFNRV